MKKLIRANYGHIAVILAYGSGLIAGDMGEYPKWFAGTCFLLLFWAIVIANKCSPNDPPRE